MEIKELLIYPIKGFPAVEMQSSYALERGMEGDRRLMLVDENGIFVSQRTEPKFTQFEISLGLRTINVKYGEETNTINIDDFLDQKAIVEVWGNRFLTSVMNPIYNGFFSELLGKNYRLVSMQSGDVRYKRTSEQKEVEVSFADGYPYLFTGTASLAELNSRLENSIPMNRFRANLVLETEDAYVEEKIDKFQLGGAEFQMLKPCKRCQVITIDQDTGKSTKEPLQTLSTYRKFNGGVNFGMNAICIKEGIVTKGDKLIIQD